MVLDKDIAKKTPNSSANKAIKLQPQNPFTWASGWHYQYTVTIELVFLT